MCAVLDENTSGEHNRAAHRIKKITIKAVAITIVTMTMIVTLSPKP